MDLFLDTQGRLATPVVELLVLLIGFAWIGIWLQGAYSENESEK